MLWTTWFAEAGQIDRNEGLIVEGLFFNLEDKEKNRLEANAPPRPP